MSKRRTKQELDNYVCPECFHQINKCICEHYPPYYLMRIDKNIQYHIIELNRKGYVTIGCCEGHYKGVCRDIFIAFNQNYDELKKDMPDGFKWKKSKDAIIFTLPQNQGEEYMNNIKMQKIEELRQWVDNLPDLKK